MRYAFAVGLIVSLSACATTGSGSPQAGPVWTDEMLVGTMWSEICPGGDPAETWLAFYEDGTFAYLYLEAEWEYDGDETWRVEGGDLIVAWNNDFASSRYPLDASGRLAGRSTKACSNITLEYTGPAPDLEWTEDQDTPGSLTP